MNEASPGGIEWLLSQCRGDGVDGVVGSARWRAWASVSYLIGSREPCPINPNITASANDLRTCNNPAAV